MNEKFDKFLNGFMRVANTKPLLALKDGFVLTMPATLIGSIFLLLANLPIPNYEAFMEGTFGANWNLALNQVSGASFDILAILSVVGIAYSYAKNDGKDGISTGFIALIAFLTVSPSSIISEAGDEIGGVIPRDWTGAQGVIAAIIVGLITGYIYCLFMEKDIRIKMPEGVPTGVTNAFSALIPGLVIVTLAAVVYQISMTVAGQSMTEIIFNTVQVPLQGLSDSWGAGVVVVVLMSLLFWAGLHGPNIVMGVMNPIFTANALDNTTLYESGTELTTANGAKIMTPQVIDLFVKFGGTGLTLGLLVSALLVAKSKQMKQISGLALVPGLFNINEPVIFGLPIVFNPIMLVPFIVAPLVSLIITYGAIAIGFMTPFINVQIPWTTPVLISGFLVGGWQGIVVQLLIFVASVAIYYPFVRKQDQVWYEEETAA